MPAAHVTVVISGQIVAAEHTWSTRGFQTDPKQTLGVSGWNRERPGQYGCAARDLNPEPAD
jgi:hypothetical protein